MKLVFGHIVAMTDKAVLWVTYDDDEQEAQRNWIPRSQIDGEGLDHNVGDEEMYVAPWLCAKLEL